MLRPFSLNGIALACAVLAVTLPGEAFAQRHAISDSSIAASLLVGALSLPSPARYPLGDSVFARRFTRGEIQYNRTSMADIQSMVVVGVRSDDVTLDSLNWNATVFGLRTGLTRTAAGNDDLRVSALELYFGGRTLGHMEGGRANVGTEIVVGWSGLESNTRASLGFRFPVEFISRRGPASVAFSLVPAVAWGQLRFRSCEDTGSGDGCSPHGIQFAMGRTRFVLGTGLTLATRRGISVTAGAQQLFARTQQPRFALALALGR